MTEETPPPRPRYGDFPLSELIDLALCSPEVGTVNFSILRLVLHNIVEKLGMESRNVTLRDVQTNQIENFKTYIAGNAQNTPMPGVLRVTPAPGFSYGVKHTEGPDGTLADVVVASTPSMNPYATTEPQRTPRAGGHRHHHRRSDPSPQAKTAPDVTPVAVTAPVQGSGGASSRSPSPGHNEGIPSPRMAKKTKALEDKVDRLEKHLEALYQLPTTSQLLDSGERKSAGMTVNDMWQIIQLNNRVASCESAIQKMATLIEDLAQDLNDIKGDTSSNKADAAYLKGSHSQISTELPNLSSKCLLVQVALDDLKQDLKNIQHEWKKELDKITKIVGIDDALIPSFLRPTTSDLVGKGKVPKKSKGPTDLSDSTGDYSDPSDGTVPDFREMSPESVALFPVERLAKMTAKELAGITPSITENMLPDQIEKINQIRDAALISPDDINLARKSQIKNIRLKDLQKLTPEEAAAIKPSKMVYMTESQLKVIRDVKQGKGKRVAIDFQAMDPEYISRMPLSEMDNMTPSQAAILSESILKYMTPEQRKKIEEIKARGKTDPTKLSPGKIGKLSVDETSKISPENLTEEQKLSPDQQQQVSKTKKKSIIEQEGDQEKKDEEKPANLESPKQKTPQPTGKHRHSHSHHKHHHGHHSHSPVDFARRPIPIAEALPHGRMNEEDTKEIVQVELQKQYAQLQIQQRQLSNDIHEKMEFIYQKLLREIVTQTDTGKPYMSDGAPEVLGPGICMPAGTAGVAVCQFPEAGGRHTKEQQMYDPKVCPGPGICPASDNCPNCNAYAMQSGPRPVEHMQQGQQISPHQNQRQPEQGMMDHSDQGEMPIEQQYVNPSQNQQHVNPPHHQHHPGQPPQMSSKDAGTGGPYNKAVVEDQLLVKEMRSLILLDLEKIREDMKAKGTTGFDEDEIMERLDTIWEALKIIKNNEETLAVKILRQDAILKKLPLETINIIHTIPAENLEAIASAKWDKPMMLPGSIGDKRGVASRRPAPGPKTGISLNSDAGSSMDKDDVQNIYNNLSNLIAESTDHKNRLQGLSDLVRTLEIGMVTKQMLVDALGDKADKGQINTKVSYDEFVTALDGLNTSIRDLVVEGLNRNDHWKYVTDELIEDVSKKLDKAELSPVKAFFKSNIKTLDDKVRQLQLQIEEPDPAGSRRKLLKDYNCLSCDRHCSISGITNAPTLPVIGPIQAGHTTASKRAFDLHRMRIKKKFDEDCRNLPMMERQLRSLGLLNPDGSLKTDSQLHKVSRYQGGSHTAITTTSRVRSSHAKRGSFLPEIQTSAAAVGGGDSTQRIEPIFESEEAEEASTEMEMEEDQEGNVSELLDEQFVMPDEDLEQAEETEQLLQSYIPTYIEE